jgi:hypothetical protein
MRSNAGGIYERHSTVVALVAVCLFMGLLFILVARR